MKNDDFQYGKMVADGRFFNTYSIFDGGDLMKNDDFQEGKMVVVRRFLHTYSIFDGGDLMKNDYFHYKIVCRNTKTFLPFSRG